MPDITVAIDEKLLDQGQKYAETHGISFSELIRCSLQNTLESKKPSHSKSGFSELWELADKAIATAPKDIKPWKFNREEIYEERMNQIMKHHPRREQHDQDVP